MENVQYAESLVKEFLLFRGFTQTLKAFEAELAADRAQGFQVDRIVDLLLGGHVARFEADKMVALFAFFKERFFSRMDARYHATVVRLEAALQKHYIVHAVQKGRLDRVVAFFQQHGEALLERREEWLAWFAIPYMKNPGADPRFQVFFTKEWLDTFVMSLRNFLCEVFDSLRLPAILSFHEEALRREAAGDEVQKLRSDCAGLRTMLAVRDQEITDLQERTAAGSDPAPPGAAAGPGGSGARDDGDATAGPFPAASANGATGPPLPSDGTGGVPAGEEQGDGPSRPDTLLGPVPAGDADPPGQSGESDSDRLLGGFGGLEVHEPEPTDVAMKSQELFSGHTSPIARCRFSVTGRNVASASTDGTVRIWTADPALPATRNAAIYCGAQVLALEWEAKHDRLLLLGTAERTIKAWNVESKRVMCDVTTPAGRPRVLDIKCSPSDAVFACASATGGRAGEGGAASPMGFGALSLWSMRSWKPISSLPLGDEPPIVTSLCFNHNGKILATSATDGFIRLFDMNACLPITGWPAHEGCAASCVRFGHDQTSLFSLGADGRALEWSVHNQGQVLRSRDASRFCATPAGQLPRHEMALDAEGQTLLLTSNTTSAPLFSIKDMVVRLSARHGGPVTSVDWNVAVPSPMFLTASADHSVRITRL